jgi:hypothetical protein
MGVGMQSEPQQRSLNELIEIAKRAQSILGHLDLEAIASQDPDAVAKLAPSDTPENRSSSSPTRTGCRCSTSASRRTTAPPTARTASSSRTGHIARPTAGEV